MTACCPGAGKDDMVDYLDSHLDLTMSDISLAKAKAHLSELVARAEAGEVISITRRGKPVAVLSAATKQRKPFSLEDMRRLTDSMPMQKENAGVFIRKMRDSSRY